MLLEDVSIEEGDSLRQSDFQGYFGHGATGKGIEIRYDDKDQKYLWLFAKEGGRYVDDIGTDRFTYVGEDPQGPGVDNPGQEDQELKRGNAALREAIDNPLPIFLFFQPDDTDTWEFRGLVEVVSFEYKPQGERYVYEFTLERNETSLVGEGTGFTSDVSLDESERVPDVSPPPRTESTLSRVVRNSPLVQQLKRTYDYECQVCGEKRQKEDRGYAEGHHLRPLGSPHHGPDEQGNILVLCPNHYADFDYGMMSVDPETYEITHSYDSEVDGRELALHPDHELDSRYLEYHNQGLTRF